MSEKRLAGEALDAEIATRVMGWTEAPAKNPPNRHWPISSSRTWRAPGSPLARALPAFSTDIAAASLVMAEMIERGWRWGIDGPNNAGRWDIVIDNRETDAYAVATELTLPHAICRAALATLPASSPQSAVGGVA